MSTRKDPGYYGVRAGEERRKAECAEDPRASLIHADLAARCQELSADPDLHLPTFRNEGEGSENDELNSNVC